MESAVANTTQPGIAGGMAMVIANSTESGIDSSTALTVLANPPSELVSVFDGSVRTSSQLPQLGDIVQLKIRDTNLVLGPPSVTTWTSARGTRRSLHVIVITGANEDVLHNKWSVTGFLGCRFSRATVPENHVANMDPNVRRLLLPLPSVLAPCPPTPAEFGAPLLPHNFAAPRHTWLWTVKMWFEMDRQPVYSPPVSSGFLC
jgi:hypothetical protein